MRLLLVYLLLGSAFAFDFSLRDRSLTRIRSVEETVKELTPLWIKHLHNNQELYSIHDIYNTLRLESDSTLSKECKEDLTLILHPDEILLNTTDFASKVLAPMIDSSGKVGPGIMRGHFEFKGLYNECRKVDFAVPGRERRLRGAYFQVDIDNKFRNNDIKGACNISKITGVMWLGAFTFDVCLPDSCSSAELQWLVRPATGVPLVPNKICAVRKMNDRIPDINAGFYITLTIMGLIAVVSIASGIVDYTMMEKWKDRSFTKGLPWKLFMACSIYSNIGSIFNVESAGKDGQIGAIHCMRAVSMCWVILGHSMMYSFMLISNPLDGAAIESTFFGQVILSACIAVDTFFFLSGLMLAFFWFKTFKAHPKQVNSVKGWIMFYVHRLWRLSPPLYIFVLFYTFVFKQLLLDTPYNFVEYSWWDKCSSTWWTEFLYFQNFEDNAHVCTGYTWYLDTDMQIFLFTPLLLLPMAFKPLIGLAIGVLIMVISTGLNMFMVFHFDYPASYNTAFDANTTHMDIYQIIMYGSPIIRCQIYLIGMAVGWLLQHVQRVKIHWVANLSIWIVVLSMLSAITLGLYSEGTGTALPLFWRAMYSSFSRVGWGVGLAWIVVACWYGYGGPINEIMSAKFWIPLGRLTYCGYLLQIPIIMLLSSLHKSEVYLSSSLEMVVTRTIPATVVTFFFAIIYSALFEINFVKIESILLK